MTITDDDIQALIDNELSVQDAEYVMRELENTPELMKRFLQLKQQKQLLRLWWNQEKEKIH